CGGRAAPRRPRGAGGWARTERARAFPGLARGYGGAPCRGGHARLSLASRAARQCRDRGLGRPPARGPLGRPPDPPAPPPPAGVAGPAGLIGDGETGLLVPVEDAAALAAAIGLLAGDAALRQRLAEAGRAAYAVQFSEATVVARYREFLERVAR